MPMDLPFLGKKARKTDGTPYCEFRSGSWTWKVLKTYQMDQAKPYARWFCQVVTPMTGSYGDLGDTYVRDILIEGRAVLAVVDGREPTAEEKQAVEAIRVKLGLPDNLLTKTPNQFGW